MSYSKYKDATPEETINKIQRLYKEKLNLEMKLKVSKRVDGIYSATLTDTNAMWNTCGKGTSELFCSASAYGESVEHLCNFFAYEIANLSEEANTAFGFEKYPDEVVLPFSDITKELPDMLLDLHDAYNLANGKDITDASVIELWQEFLEREKVPFVPYYSVRTGIYKKVPENIIFYLCGSNGGGAGNTPEEAIGHACDEILERYVKYTMYMRQLTPPEVTRNYIQERCPELLDVINKLEDNDGYKVIVKDASMGKGYAVMSVLLINQNNAEYLVNFGAHPIFEIALERCLTELLQAFIPGKYNHRKNMEKWNGETQKRFAYHQNWVTILNEDSGVVPDSYFAGNPSWEFKPWPVYEEYSNKLGMDIQIKQLLSIAPDVYIHDSSYLGFPAYRVYVPTVSTSHIPFDEFQLRCYHIMEEFPSIVEKGRLTREETKEIEETLFSHNTFVNGLIFRNLGESRFHLLHAALCYDLAEFDKAKKYLGLARSKYSECLTRKIELDEHGSESNIVSNLLELFYGDDISALAKKWSEIGAFPATLDLYIEYGISFSPRIFMKDEMIKATNALHIALKEAMIKYERCDTLHKLFEDLII